MRARPSGPQRLDRSRDDAEHARADHDVDRPLLDRDGLRFPDGVIEQPAVEGPERQRADCENEHLRLLVVCELSHFSTSVSRGPASRPAACMTPLAMMYPYIFCSCIGVARPLRTTAFTTAAISGLDR